MKKFLISVLCLLLCIFSGCAAREDTRTFFCMDTEMSVSVSGADAERNTLRAENELYRLDAMLDAQSESSELYAFNHGAQPGGELSALIARSRHFSEETSRAFDPEILELMALWGYFHADASVPSEDTVSEALHAAQKSTDLGGIAKGYAAERLRAMLTENGVRSAILNLGGNIAVIGKNPSGRPWVIGLQDPSGAPGSFFASVRLCDKSVVTSGGYERYFEQDGVRYCHILDPKTGRPAQTDLLSATIVSAQDTLADAYSTALYVMGSARAAEFWQSHAEDFDFVLLRQDGTVLVTEGIAADFSCELHYEVLQK